MNFDEADLKHWELHGTMPPSGKYSYRANQTVHVLALTAQRAIMLAQREYPGLLVYTVSHRGKVGMIKEAVTDFPELLDTVGMG